VKVSEARRILLEQEFDRLVDMEDVTATALERVETLGIVFSMRSTRSLAKRVRWAGRTSRAKAYSATCCPSSKGQRADEVRDGENDPHPVVACRSLPRLQAF